MNALGHLAFMQVLHGRVKELFALYNAEQFDALLATYTEDVRFSLPSHLDGSFRTGCGREALGQAFADLLRAFGPVTVVDVFGVLRSRSIVVDDAEGGRVILSVEVNEMGLGCEIFAVRVKLAMAA